MFRDVCCGHNFRLKVGSFPRKRQADSPSSCHPSIGMRPRQRVSYPKEIEPGLAFEEKEAGDTCFLVAGPCDWLASVYCRYVRKARLGWLSLLWPSLACEESAFYPMSLVGMKTMQKKMWAARPNMLSLESPRFGCGGLLKIILVLASCPWWNVWFGLTTQ